MSELFWKQIKNHKNTTNRRGWTLSPERTIYAREFCAKHSDSQPIGVAISLNTKNSWVVLNGKPIFVRPNVCYRNGNVLFNRKHSG